MSTFGCTSVHRTNRNVQDNRNSFSTRNRKGKTVIKHLFIWQWVRVMCLYAVAAGYKFKRYIAVVLSTAIDFIVVCAVRR